jgi:hypothetical protein
MSILHQEVFLMINFVDSLTSRIITEELIMNPNNSGILSKNLKSFMGLSLGNKRSCLVKIKNKKNLVTLSF